MENNVLQFINSLRADNKNLDSYVLYQAVKNDDALLKRLCDAVFNTYGNIEHIKKFLG